MFTLQAWVDALRSDTYKQGQGALKQYDPQIPDSDCFCVMGVAADLIDPDGWEPAPLGFRNEIFRWRDQGAYLPGDTLETYKLTDLSAILMNQNDSGLPFSVLADNIEHYAHTHGMSMNPLVS